MRLERRQIIVITLVCVALLLAGIWLLRSPRNDREWAADSKVLSWGTVEGRTVTIHNLRDTRWRTTTDGDLAWRDETYDLDMLSSVEYLVEDLQEFPGFAHTLLSFGFSDGRHVAISVEIRKEEGESYSPIRGMLRSYELRYVIGTERDLIGLRTHARNHTAYLYPIKATPVQREALLVDMLDRADRLRTTPEYYNTFTSTCTTNLVRHANAVSPGRIPWDVRILLPEYSDRLAYDLGLIDTALPWESVRATYRIDEKARAGSLDETYSARLRS